MPRPTTLYATDPLPVFLQDPARACRNTPMAMWVSDLGRRFDAGPAKARCARCPILEACREYAIARDWTYGVWGGLTQRDRRDVRLCRSRRRRVGRCRHEVAGVECPWRGLYGVEEGL